jgi:hypothetical protein
MSTGSAIQTLNASREDSDVRPVSLNKITYIAVLGGKNSRVQLWIGGTIIKGL